jgi:AraC-like DNA-binding protein
MIQFDTFSTADVEPRRKMEYWNDYATDSFTPIVSDPVDVPSFNAHLSRTQLHGITLAEVYSDAQIVRHSQTHVARARKAIFFLHMQLDGVGVVRQSGREALLRSGDFAITDTTRPYELVFDDSKRMLVIGVEHELMRRYLRNPEDWVSMRMPGDVGLSGVTSELLRAFWKALRGAQLDSAMAPRVMYAALELLSGASLGKQPQGGRSSMAIRQRGRILDYIETHLGDADLSPSTIGRACGITPRYLHHLFMDEDETVARYVLRRRLEECSKALISVSQRNRTLTSIAFDHGFNSPTHFGRAFRERFGMTPREYRRAHGY